MSVTVRVIPCLDVDQGRVVKGVNFVDLRDAGEVTEPNRVDGGEPTDGAGDVECLDAAASM